MNTMSFSGQCIHACNGALHGRFIAPAIQHRASQSSLDSSSIWWFVDEEQTEPEKKKFKGTDEGKWFRLCQRTRTGQAHHS